MAGPFVHGMAVPVGDFGTHFCNIIENIASKMGASESRHHSNLPPTPPGTPANDDIDEEEIRDTHMPPLQAGTESLLDLPTVEPILQIPEEPVAAAETPAEAAAASQSEGVIAGSSDPAVAPESHVSPIFDSSATKTSRSVIDSANHAHVVRELRLGLSTNKRGCA